MQTLFFLISLSALIKRHVLATNPCVPNNIKFLGDLCLECDYNHYRTFDALDKTILNPTSDCLSITIPYLKLDIFIKNKTTTKPGVKNGSVAAPFDTIAEAFTYGHKRASECYYSEINFYLLGELHYVFQNAFPKFGTRIPFFRRVNASITIKPYDCSGIYGIIEGCLAGVNIMVTVYLKSDAFSLFAAYQLVIERVNFYGNDVILGYLLSLANSSLTCLNDNTLCCSETKMATSGSYCYIKGFSFLSKFYLDINLEKGFLNIEGIHDDPHAVLKPATLKIIKCGFYNFYMLANYYTWVSLFSVENNYNADLLLQEVTIYSGRFYQGLIATKLPQDSYFFIGNILNSSSKINLSSLYVDSYNRLEVWEKFSVEVPYIKNIINIRSLVVDNCTFRNLIYTKITKGLLIFNLNNTDKVIFTKLIMNYSSNIMFFRAINCDVIQLNFSKLDYLFFNTPLIQCSFANLTIFNTSLVNLRVVNTQYSTILVSGGTLMFSFSFLYNSLNIIFQFSNMNSVVIADSLFVSFYVTTRTSCESVNTLISIINTTFSDIYYITAWLSVRYDNQEKACLNVSLKNLNISKMRTDYGVLVSWKYAIRGSSFLADSLLIENSNIYYILDSSDIQKSNIQNLILNNNTNFKVLFALNPSFIKIKNISINNILLEYYLILVYGVSVKNYTLIIENITMNNTEKNVEVPLIWTDGDFVFFRQFTLENYHCSETYNEVDMLFVFNSPINLTVASIEIRLKNNSIKIIFYFVNIDYISISDSYFYNQLANSSQVQLSTMTLMIFSFIKEVSINNISVENYKGRSDKNDPYFSNGLLNFISSDSFYLNQNNHSVLLNNISLVNNYGWERGIVAFLNIHKIIVKGLLCINTSVSYGGTIFLAFSTHVYFEDINLKQNYAAATGGAIYLEWVKTIYIYNINITDSRSDKAGVFYISRCEELKVVYMQISNASSNLRGGAFYLTQSNIQFYHVEISSCRSENEGGALFFDRGVLSLNDFKGINLFARKGGALFILISDNITISDAVLVNCVAVDSGASLYIMDLNYMELLNCNITGVGLSAESSNNTVGNIYIANQKQVKILFTNLSCENHIIELGACIYFFSDSHLTINNFIATNLSGQIFLFSSWRGGEVELNQVTILNSKNKNLQYFAEFQYCAVFLNAAIFSNLTLKKDLFLFIKSNITSEHLRITDVSTSYSNPKPIIILDLYYCSMIVYNLSIYYTGVNKVYKLVYIDADSSQVQIKDSYINKCLSGNLGCIVIKLSEIIMWNSEVSENSENYGATIYIRDSKAYIKNTSFWGNRLSKDLYSNIPSDTAYLTIGVDICSFFSRKQENSKTDSLIVEDCLFKVTSQTYPSVVSENLTQCLYINTSFLGDDASEDELRMSSIVTKSGNLSVTGCKFDQLFAYRGAGIRLINIIPVAASFTLYNSIFTRMKANLGGSIYLRGFIQASIEKANFNQNRALINSSFNSGIGGCLYFVCFRCEASYLKISMSKFEFNQAEAFSPIVFSQASITSNSNTFFNNTDKMNFTQEISAFPLNVTLSDGKIKDQIQVEIGSGIEFELYINLTDSFGQVLKFDSFSIGRLLKPSQSSIKIDGAYASFVHGEGFFKTVVKAKPQSSFNIILNIELSTQRYLSDLIEPNPLDNATINLTFYSRPCLIGEIYIISDMSCKRCEKGKFSTIDPMNEQNFNAKCLNCPDNAECPGGSIILPKPGYWRAHSNSTMISECLAESTCLGGTFTNAENYNTEEGYCLLHHTGRFCYKCEKDFGRLYSKGICVDCSASALTYLKIILASFALFLYILIQVKYTLKSGFKSYSGILIKLLINHYQKLSIISVLNLGWTTDVKNYFELQEYFSFISEESISLDCLFQNLPFETLIRKVLLTFILVVLLFLTSCLFFLIIMLVKRCLKWKVSGQYLQERFTMSAIAVIYVLFPENMRKIFSLLNCVELESNSLKKVVLQSPEIECWGSDHFFYFYTIVIPGFFFWAVLVPSLYAVLLYVNKAQIKKMLSERNPHIKIDVKFSENEKIMRENSAVRSVNNISPDERRLSPEGGLNLESEKRYSPPEKKGDIMNYFFRGVPKRSSQQQTDSNTTDNIFTLDKSRHLLEIPTEKEEKQEIKEIDEIEEIASQDPKNERSVKSLKFLEDKGELKVKEDSVRENELNEPKMLDIDEKIALEIQEEKKVDDEGETSKFNESLLSSPKILTHKKKSTRDTFGLDLVSIKSESLMMMGGDNLFRNSFAHRQMQQIVGFKKTLIRVSKFLYVGYHPDYFYWDIIILFQKTLFISVGNYTDIFPLESKGIFFMIILSIFIFIQKKFSPFETTSLNRLENISLFSNFITTLFGLLLFTPNLKKGGTYIMIIIIVSHTIFFIYWLYTFWTIIAIKKKMYFMVNSFRHSIKRLRLSTLSFNRKSKSNADVKIPS